MALLHVSRALTPTLLHRTQCTPQLRSFAADAASEPVYVVFGAAGAVGSELVRRLAAQPGAKVVASDINESDLGELGKAVQDVHAHPADTQDSAAVAEVIGKAKEQYGKVDSVASCVGNMLIKPAHLTSDEEFMECIKVNTFSSFNILKAAAQAMMKTGGSIALCSSSIAHRGFANHDALAAAKGAISGMALSAASTYSPHNIRVNVCVPGVIASKMTGALVRNDNALEASEKMHPLGRIGEAEEVARALEFLMHPENSFITGTFLHVDGGLGSVAPARAGDSKAVKH